MDATFRSELVRLLPRLRRFAFGLTGSRDEADDLVQEACSRAMERADQWRLGTRLDSWMFRIVQTVRIDRLRAGEHRPGIAPDLLDALPGGDAGPEIEARVTLTAVRRAIGRLPDDQRAVLLLVCVEGLTYREAAESLGVPVGTVMSRLSRARTALTAMLERPPGAVVTAFAKR